MKPTARLHGGDQKGPGIGKSLPRTLSFAVCAGFVFWTLDEFPQYASMFLRCHLVLLVHFQDLVLSRPMWYGIKKVENT